MFLVVSEVLYGRKVILRFEKNFTPMAVELARVFPKQTKKTPRT